MFYFKVSFPNSMCCGDVQLFNPCGPMLAMLSLLHFSHHVPQRQKFWSHVQIDAYGRGRVSSPCCGLLISTIHVCFDLCSLMQPPYRLLLAGSWAALLPGPHAIYCCLRQQPSPTAHPLLCHAASAQLLGQCTLACLQFPQAVSSCCSRFNLPPLPFSCHSVGEVLALADGGFFQIGSPHSPAIWSDHPVIQLPIKMQLNKWIAQSEL